MPIDDYIISALLGRDINNLDDEVKFSLREIFSGLDFFTINIIRKCFIRWYLMKCEIDKADSANFNLQISEYALIMALNGCGDIIGWSDVRRKFYVNAFNLNFFIDEFFPQGAYKVGVSSLQWENVDQAP